MNSQFIANEFSDSDSDQASEDPLENVSEKESEDLSDEDDHKEKSLQDSSHGFQ